MSAGRVWVVEFLSRKRWRLWDRPTLDKGRAVLNARKWHEHNPHMKFRVVEYVRAK